MTGPLKAKLLSRLAGTVLTSAEPAGASTRSQNSSDSPRTVRILEVGSGPGTNLQLLAAAFKGRGVWLDITGVDKNNFMQGYAREVCFSLV